MIPLRVGSDQSASLQLRAHNSNPQPLGAIKVLQERASIGSLLRGLWADFGSRIAISGNNVLKDCPCVTCRFLNGP